MGLVEGYDTMGFAMSKPHLRAELEADLKRYLYDLTTLFMLVFVATEIIKFID